MNLYGPSMDKHVKNLKPEIVAELVYEIPEPSLSMRMPDNSYNGDPLKRLMVRRSHKSHSMTDTAPAK